MARNSNKPWFDFPAAAEKDAEIAIIGGGVSGLMTAHHLSNYHKVTLIDKNDHLMQGASGNPAAILEPKVSIANSIEKEFYASAFRYAVDFYKNLPDGIFNQCGLIRTPKDKSELEKFSKLPSLYPPSFLQLTDKGLYFPNAGYVIPPALKETLSGNFKGIFNQNITQIQKTNDQRWALINEHGDNIVTADIVIISNSFLANEFAQSNHLYLKKLSGQISFIKTQQNQDTIFCSEGYLTPKVFTKNGIAQICGATFEQGIQENVSSDAHQKNIDKSPLPLAEPEILGGRCATRAMVKDHLPICGPLPVLSDYQKHYNSLIHGPRHKIFPAASYHNNLYISAGLGARGFLTAPLLASVVTTQIRGGKLPISDKIYHALHPARFIIRKLSKK